MEFRIAYVPGVTLGTWTRIWAERYPGIPLELLASGAQELWPHLDEHRVDVAFARLEPSVPDDGSPAVPERFHVIRLYDEQPFVVLPRDHAFADEKSLAIADLTGEPRFDPSPSLTPEDAVAVVAAGTGIAVVPQSLARLHSRKDVVSRPVTDLPPTTIALVWPKDDPAEAVDDFIGVVRGRTAASSRGRRGTDDAASAPAPARSASRGADRSTRSARPGQTSKASRGGSRKRRGR